MDSNTVVTDVNGAPDLSALAFPLSRVKQIIKKDSDIHIISQDAVFILAKSAELFIEKMAYAAYESANSDRRKIVQYRDLFRASQSIDEFVFLEDILPEAPLSS